MKHLCLTLPESPERQERAQAHFTERGVTDVHFVMGINAEKAGLTAGHVYEIDAPGSGYKMGPKPTGIWLGHYIAWCVCAALPDEHFLIFEDDVILPEDWQEKYKKALADTPENWDVLFFGSCCTEGYPKKHIAGNIFETKHAQCLHAYAVSKRAVEKMIRTQRDCYGPVDILLIFHTFEHLKVYVVLPRLAIQVDTAIPP